MTSEYWTGGHRVLKSRKKQYSTGGQQSIGKEDDRILDRRIEEYWTGG
jgi:hypothetical protein